MPLSPIQAEVLRLTAGNRSKESHLAGASGIHMSPEAMRISHDLDLFHDSEKAVADAYARDAPILLENGFQIDVALSQPGFIRAHVSKGDDRVLIDWARDSIWRFLEPIRLEEVGYVLHPVDLAVNKALALAGRDEARDFLDTIYLHQNVLPLGALVWAACGKDPGLNPSMLLELLKRKGLISREEMRRLDLQTDLDLDGIHAVWKGALQEAAIWIGQRPPEEAGCLYSDPNTGLFFAPANDEAAETIRGKPGGVVPRIHGIADKSYLESPQQRQAIKSFFQRELVE